MQSVNLLAQAAMRAARRVKAMRLPRILRAGAHYRDSGPAAQADFDQTLLRYNGMLMSVFELLADAREQATAVSGYIAALKDYWTAQANLEAALGGRLPPTKEYNHDHPQIFERRGTLIGAGMVSKAGAATLPEAPVQSSAATQGPLLPPNGRPYNPVVTLNGWTLPWRMKDGVKEFHLVAEPVVREIAPGMTANLWGYNGQSPGPTIEVVEGDRVRIFVTNKLPEHTSVHWHGQRLPNGMDGVTGLTQPASRRARPLSTSSSPRTPAPSCTTRMPTRWRRWRWA
jgi:hypothetical protein